MKNSTYTEREEKTRGQGKSSMGSLPRKKKREEKKKCGSTVRKPLIVILFITLKLKTIHFLGSSCYNAHRYYFIIIAVILLLLP